MSAAIAIGAVAVGAGVAGSVMSANAQKDAASSNAKSAKSDRELQYKQWQESRGLSGNAIYPMYGGDTEKSIWDNVVKSYEALGLDDPTARLSEFQAITGANQPAMDAAAARANSIFNGRLVGEQLENFAPVARGRVVFKRQAAIDSLNKTLGEIDAAQASRGFSGDSLGKRMLSYKANAGAANAIGEANLANLEETRAIKDRGLALQLQNLNLPGQMTEQQMNFFRLPQDTFIDSVLKGQKLFDNFRIGTGTPPALIRTPTVSAIPSAGQLALQGVGQAAGSALNYWQQGQQQKAFNDLALKTQSNNVMAANGVPSQFYYGSTYNPAATVSSTTGFDYTPPSVAESYYQPTYG